MSGKKVTNSYRFIGASLLGLLLAGPARAQSNARPRAGDLLFQNLDCGPLCDAIEAVTEGYHGHDYSHMGLVVQRHDSLLVLEAAGTAVRLRPLASFARSSPHPLLVARLLPRYQALLPAATAFALAQLGTPYDDEYVYDNGRYYCSELLYDAFKAANHGQAFFELQPMTYKQPGTEAFFPAWVAYYHELGRPIPEGQPGCNPGGLSRSAKLRVVGEYRAR